MPTLGTIFIWLIGQVLIWLSLIFVFKDLSTNNRINLWLTFNIAIFGAVEGYSTWVQSALFNKRNKIEDLRNELEKAYGPLYTIVNLGEDRNNKPLRIKFQDKKKIDSIFSRFPFMIPSQTYEYWKKKIQPLKEEFPTYSEHCLIPLKFKNMINTEYEIKYDKYNKLLKKVKEESESVPSPVLWNTPSAACP